MKVVLATPSIIQKFSSSYAPYWNCEVLISRKIEDILGADKIILPGVGAFARAWKC